MDVTKRLFFNEWKIVRLIGEGSYGKVYLASKNLFGETVFSAIKIITIPQNQSQVNEEIANGHSQLSVKRYFRGIVDEWQKEISILNKLKGAQSIVIFEDFEIIEYQEEVKWDIVIRMEYLTPLSDVLRSKVFMYEDGIKLGIDLAKALVYCSQEGIIHRDIKPENIFMSKYGDFKLGDFGIAKQVEMTISMMSKKGTFLYMAPEVFRGETYDKSVDIYSLGLVLYRLFNNNKLPFVPLNKEFISFEDREKSLLHRLSGNKMDLPINSSPSLSNIILKCCEFESINRYQDPKVLYSELLSELKHTEQNGNRILINIQESRQSVIEILDNQYKTVGIFNQQNSNKDTSRSEHNTNFTLKDEILHSSENEEITNHRNGAIIDIDEYTLRQTKSNTSITNGNQVEIELISGVQTNRFIETNEMQLINQSFDLLNLKNSHQILTEQNIYDAESCISNSDNNCTQNTVDSHPISDITHSDKLDYSVSFESNENDKQKPVHQYVDFKKKMKIKLIIYFMVCFFAIFVILAIIKLNDYFDSYETFRMINLVGMTEEDATKELNEMGIEVLINYIKTFDYNHGEVINQSIEKGVEIKGGDRVTLDVVQYKSVEYLDPSHYPLFKEGSSIQKSMLFSYLISYYNFYDWNISIDDVYFSLYMGEDKSCSSFSEILCRNLSVGVWKIKAVLRRNNWLIQEFTIGVLDNLNAYSPNFSIQPFLPVLSLSSEYDNFYSFSFTDTDLSRNVTAVGYLSRNTSVNCYVYDEVIGEENNVSCSISGDYNIKSYDNYYAKTITGNTLVYTKGSKTTGAWDIEFYIETLIGALQLTQDSKYDSIIEKLRLLQSQ